MAVISGRGTARATPHAKNIIARAMYSKGKAFIGAAILLQRESLRRGSTIEQIDYVILHLFCQGIEVMLKGLLLVYNFDKYNSQLRRFGRSGHDLVKLSIEASTAYSLKPMRDILTQELSALSDFYSSNQLRYAGIGDIFIDPRSIHRDSVIRRVAAVMRLAERKLS